MPSSHRKDGRDSRIYPKTNKRIGNSDYLGGRMMHEDKINPTDEGISVRQVRTLSKKLL